jgi:hypothetical protein
MPNSGNHSARKGQELFLRRLNYALGRPRGGACFKVQIEQVDGMVDEIKGKEKLHEAIWDNIHCKHFYLAKEAPMCSGPLRGPFGSQSVLQPGTFWREHTNILLILMKQPKRFYKNVH